MAPLTDWWWLRLGEWWWQWYREEAVLGLGDLEVRGKCTHPHSPHHHHQQLLWDCAIAICVKGSSLYCWGIGAMNMGCHTHNNDEADDDLRDVQIHSRVHGLDLCHLPVWLGGETTTTTFLLSLQTSNKNLLVIRLISTGSSTVQHPNEQRNDQRQCEHGYGEWWENSGSKIGKEKPRWMVVEPQTASSSQIFSFLSSMMRWPLSLRKKICLKN